MNILILTCLATLAYESSAFAPYGNSETPFNKFGYDTYQEPVDDFAYSGYDNYGQTSVPEFYDPQFRELAKKASTLDNFQPAARPFSNLPLRQNGFQIPFYNINPAESYSRYNGPFNPTYQEQINYPQLDSFNQNELFAPSPFDTPTYQNVPDNIPDTFNSPDFSSYRYPVNHNTFQTDSGYSSPIVEEPIIEFRSAHPQTASEVSSYSSRSNTSPNNLQFHISSHYPTDSTPSDHQSSSQTIDINALILGLTDAFRTLNIHEMLASLQ